MTGQFETSLDTAEGGRVLALGQTPHCFKCKGLVRESTSSFQTPSTWNLMFSYNNIQMISLSAVIMSVSLTQIKMSTYHSKGKCPRMIFAFIIPLSGVIMSPDLGS